MIRLLPAALVALTMSIGATPAGAATRNFTVTDFDKVKVDGPYAVDVVTGRGPFARIEGGANALDSVTVEVQGRTLVVRFNRSAWGGYPGAVMGPVVVYAGTHAVSDVIVNGAGSLSIDRVAGLNFSAAAMGSASLTIADIAADRVTVSLTGAGTARLAGQTLSLTASARGTSLIDAGALTAKDAVLSLDGPGEIRARVTGTATLSSAGPGRIALSGNPVCSTRGRSSAMLSGCR
jgi:Putative auto-transporter adhesin, head GIN domain